MRVGGNVQNSKLIRKIDPVYPELASKARVSGSVIIELKIDGEGNVTEARVVSGHPLLNEAAINAVKQWKYAPTLLNGSPVPVSATVAVVFKPDGSSKPEVVQSRLDPAVARVLARLNAGQSVDAAPFIRNGKAQVELQISDRTKEVMTKLQSLGFEIISWPEGSTKAVGRIPVKKLKSLLDIDAVRHIAPHYR
jgi:TonB family protein